MCKLYYQYNLYEQKQYTNKKCFYNWMIRIYWFAYCCGTNKIKLSCNNCRQFI